MLIDDHEDFDALIRSMSALIQLRYPDESGTLGTTY